jgi:hypothetical protein
MKKTIRLKENDLKDLIKKVIQEQEMDTDRYMFFSNLEQIHRQTGILLEMNHEEIHHTLENGHDWAQDHIATAKESIDQVFDFFMNEEKGTDHDMDITNQSMMMTDDMDVNDMGVMEGRKKAGTKLCSRGYKAAKAKFKVFPSAYSNGFAVQVCKGRMKGLDGKKRCSPPYC